MEEKTTIPQSTEPVDMYKKEDSDEIDLKEIIVQLWQKRKFILIVTGISFLIGIFIAFTSPVRYTASCTVVPQVSENSGGSMSGLASMMGINMGSVMSGETLSPSVYPQIIKSVPFCKEIMNTPITVNKSLEAPITLYEYYTDKKYQDKSLLEGIKKYTIGLPGTILAGKNLSDKADDSGVYTDTLTNQVITLTKEERNVITIIQGNTQFESNQKEGYILLGYTFAEPEAVAQITESIYATLEKYVKKRVKIFYRNKPN